VDKKTSKQLEEALINVREHQEILMMQAEQRMYKQVEFPITFKESLFRLTKSEMDYLRNMYQITGVSQLNKTNLVDALSSPILDSIAYYFSILDEERYSLIQRVANSRNGISADITHDKVLSLLDFGMIFPGEDDRGRIIFMPEEVKQIFFEIDGKELQKRIQLNTEWVHLTNGMLHYYGVLYVHTLVIFIEEYSTFNYKKDTERYFDVMNLHMQMEDRIDSERFYFSHVDVEDMDELIEEQEMRPEIDYYKFTKQQLLKASAENYFDQTTQMREFLDYLNRNYDLSKQELDDLGIEVTLIVRISRDVNVVGKYLEEVIEFPSIEVLRGLIDRLVEVYNHTRSWMLKGHSPNELSRRTELLNETPSDDQTNVVSFASGTKVVRNDPCPCGSGKKFKKCCLRSS